MSKENLSDRQGARAPSRRERILLLLLSPALFAGSARLSEPRAGAAAPSEAGALPGASAPRARSSSAATRQGSFAVRAPIQPDGSYVLGRFPLPDRYEFTDSFGDRRGRSRRHLGTDIPAPKLTPVFAVASGTVTWMHDQRGGNCCDLELQHDDGWTSRYIHLNNDTPGSDDGQGYGITDGLVAGTWVPAGTLLGWVGDSGNAEHTISHLHFELYAPGHEPINAYAGLLAAMDATGIEPEAAEAEVQFAQASALEVVDVERGATAAAPAAQ